MASAVLQRTLPAGFIAPCLPTNAPQPPSGEFWLHEIKHDARRPLAVRKATPENVLARAHLSSSTPEMW